MPPYNTLLVADALMQLQREQDLSTSLREIYYRTKHTIKGTSENTFDDQDESDPLIDDHLYINRQAGIPVIDIIDYDGGRGGFPSSWHTVGDTLDKIDKSTLAAVGRTVLAVVYQEK